MLFGVRCDLAHTVNMAVTTLNEQFQEPLNLEMFIDPALSVTKNYEKLIKITTKISFSQVQVKYE